MSAAPVSIADRIDLLDVLRGFALFGILLLNILGMGFASDGYFDANVGLGDGELSRRVNLGVWFTVELLFEGIMRGLFSMLFGAGVLLFLSGGRPAHLHFKRNFWLLTFGLFNAYVLLWNGDILVCYALASFLLYFARNASAKRLWITVGALLTLLVLMHAASGFGMQLMSDAAEQVQVAADPAQIPAEVQELADGWHEFSRDYELTAAERAAELEQRRANYWSAARWNAGEMTELYLFALPFVLFWDALLMMLVGMACFRMGWLSGQITRGQCWQLIVWGFALGFGCNLLELWAVYIAEFSLYSQFNFFKPTYHPGRLGMALGYLGLIALLHQCGIFKKLWDGCAIVGRMALTNYLMQSAFALFLFTGAGFAWVGLFERWQLYIFVAAIWVVQWWFSHWWLARYRFGPAEWLWRSLTYGKRQSQVLS